uniref:Histone-lysine N-methyltransferase SETMAR n=1 Tax=Amphilophus citrinellus TaxID=61819 RepID=A0A3Q0QTS4_AMPCI
MDTIFLPALGGDESRWRHFSLLPNLPYIPLLFAASLLRVSVYTSLNWKLNYGSGQLVSQHYWWSNSHHKEIGRRGTLFPLVRLHTRLAMLWIPVGMEDNKTGLAPKDIHADMVVTLEVDAPALSTLQKWAAKFKRGRESLKDDPRSGHPATATTQENIDRVHHMVTDDRHLTVNKIANAVGISHEQVENILHNKLGLSKVCTLWVPRLLTSDQKRTRLVMLQANLALFEENPASFLENFLTQDECWVHHFEPEIKWQSMQWKHPSSPPPKKAKVVSSAGKVMSLFSGMQKALQSSQNCLQKLKKGVLFHQNNAPAHKSMVAMAAVCNCGFELVDHPPYFPDLAPSHYFVFPNMKNHLAAKQYRTNNEVISAGEDFFEGQDGSFYTTVIQTLQDKWKKCVDRRDYVEK